VDQAAVGQVFKLLAVVLLELVHLIKVTLVELDKVLALITVLEAVVLVQLERQV
tara:strand:+ start:402 stop:563 length:162 start_codon:yes stop_codon:yes gene_type:complete